MGGQVVGPHLGQCATVAAEGSSHTVDQVRGGHHKPMFLAMIIFITSLVPP